MTTRAVHVTPVESLSTSDFLNALRCLESIRGRPDLIYTDNALGFIGAERELKPTLERLYSDIQDLTVMRGVKWQRYTPRAPHMGGVHESLVKSIKRALRATLDDTPRLLTDLELMTIFAEITGFLNSRPLTYLSTDVEDNEILTPNSFLMPKAIFEINPKIQNRKYFRESYGRLQLILNHTWERWQKEYLPSLIARAKWQQIKRDLRVNDLVLLVEETPRCHWKTGRIVQVFLGNKGHVRSVKVKTSDGEYERPAVRCCLLLPTEDANCQQSVNIQ